MSKELEYVKELKLRYKEENGTIRRLNVIETALKDYENLKYIFKLLNKYNNQNYSLEDLIKKAQALEIIKEKRVNVGSFIKCCANISYEEYKKGWGNWKKDILYNLSKEPLTQEEYDLLKEVLL